VGKLQQLCTHDRPGKLQTQTARKQHQAAVGAPRGKQERPQDEIQNDRADVQVAADQGHLAIQVGTAVDREGHGADQSRA
jgi:hypothetical protein